MKRGDLVTVSLSGDYGKPRPALVIQSDLFAGHASVTLLPITSTRIEEASLLRLDVEPAPENGLHKPSQVMIDKTHTLPREKVGPPFGRLDDGTMMEITRALSVFLGIA
ncbi:MAG: type II toxin-antitoxin system PemK/MazF family toxin [Acidobacteriota bacterium]